MDIKSVNINICLKELEELRLRIDFLASTANTCGAAFEKEDSTSIIDNRSIQETFYCINRQASDMSDKLESVIGDLLKVHNMCIQESCPEKDSNTQSDD